MGRAIVGRSHRPLCEIHPSVHEQVLSKPVKSAQGVWEGHTGSNALERSCKGRGDLGLIQALTPHRQVNGILGGSVVLSVDLSPEKELKEIEWSFSNGSGVMIQLAEFSGGKFERPDPSDRFKQRLEKYNKTSLRIKALELDDSGVYGARIKIQPAIVEDQAFLLAVYEPVPVPEIKSHSLSSTAAGCNVTLQCQVSGREKVNVSWSSGNPPRDLGDLERYQLTPDGRTLRLSLQPDLLNSTFTCTASNPVDQKNVSLYLQSICQSGGAAPSPCHWKAIIGALFLGLEISAMVPVTLLHRKML
ncbi:T-lymphocyte surface antigen Ly-9-like isoform X2 [Mauremys mutica]|uniref:T-lymphocyte surface antigen Ly-9-like isoform X2 n=1 Tax=Mauremys mutica TaxID=74926 RepID=UPI001D16754B|nr:T-lymphocyte surface antigen Ly-9-like isoform X2 [Mauremys mutica]XP_044847136.1 T-lymphocyte surface antigen Ly-9-like isoform X2 [Mauremys mutica]